MISLVRHPSGIIIDHQTATLVVEMCSFWLNIKVNLKKAKVDCIPNSAVKLAHANVPDRALEYVEWASMSLYIQMGKWTLSQFHDAREFLKNAAKHSSDIEVIS